MKIIRAGAMGMCFGVRDALEIAARVARPEEVTIYGEIVHNRGVVDGLKARGFKMAGEQERDRLPHSEAVLVTAHGISDKERGRLMNTGKRLIDTTCPLVVRVHEAAQQLAREGRYVLVIGCRGHVEVLGIVGDLDRYDILQSPDDVTVYPFDRLGIVTQSTAAERDVFAIRAAVIEQNPHADIRFVDSVCKPTKERQAAMEDLLDRVEAVVVVGGANSNNTKRLVDRCRERGRPVRHVQTSADLDAVWLQSFELVGLTAGTSTPDATIDEVERAMLAAGRIGLIRGSRQVVERAHDHPPMANSW